MLWYKPIKVRGYYIETLPQLQEERCDTEIDVSTVPIVLERDGRASLIGG